MRQVGKFEKKKLISRFCVFVWPCDAAARMPKQKHAVGRKPKRKGTYAAKQPAPEPIKKKHAAASKQATAAVRHVVLGGAWVPADAAAALDAPRATRSGKAASLPSATRANGAGSGKTRSGPASGAAAVKQLTAAVDVQGKRAAVDVQGKRGASDRSPASSPMGMRADGASSHLKRARKAPPSPANAARTAAGVAAAAADACAKQATLDALTLGVQTRRTAIEAEQRMRDERERIEAELAASRRRMREKEGDLLELLEDPLRAWDDDVFWQLAMCEFALDVDDEAAATLKPRQLAAYFRTLAARARHGAELPRFRGVNELHMLRAVLVSSERLCRELCVQLHRYKRLYCSVLRGFGRFRSVDVEPGETLLLRVGVGVGACQKPRKTGPSPTA